MIKKLDIGILLRILLQFILVITVIYTIVIAGFSNGVEIPILLTLAGGFFILKVKVIPKILLPVILLLGSGMLSSAFSINPQLSFYQTWLASCGVHLFFIFCSLEKPSSNPGTCSDWIGFHDLQLVGCCRLVSVLSISFARKLIVPQYQFPFERWEYYCSFLFINRLSISWSQF